MYKVTIEVNFEMEAGRNPSFTFKTLREVNTFTKMCLAHGYGVSIDEIE